MSDDQKKRHELKKQIASKAQIASIDLVEKVAGLLNSPKKWDIIERASTFPGDKGFETQRFILSFDYLNLNACEFEQFDPAKGKKLIQILEQVATCEINKFPTLRLSRGTVKNIAPYESLFSRVSPEVTSIEETEFCDGRLFFFITEPFFHIVSVESKHRNIDR